MKLLCLDRFLGFGKRFFDAHNVGHLRNLLLSHSARLISIATTAQMALRASSPRRPVAAQTTQMMRAAGCSLAGAGRLR